MCNRVIIAWLGLSAALLSVSAQDLICTTGSINFQSFSSPLLPVRACLIYLDGLKRPQLLYDEIKEDCSYFKRQYPSLPVVQCCNTKQCNSYTTSPLVCHNGVAPAINRTASIFQSCVTVKARNGTTYHLGDYTKNCEYTKSLNTLEDVQCCSTNGCNAPIAPKISCHVGQNVDTVTSGATYQSCATYDDANGQRQFVGDDSANCGTTRFGLGIKNFACCNTANCNTPPPKIRCYEQVGGETVLSSAKYGSCVTVPSSVGTTVTGTPELNCGYYGTLPGAICCNKTDCNVPAKKISCIVGNQASTQLSPQMFESCIVHDDTDGIRKAAGSFLPDCGRSLISGIKLITCCYTDNCNVIVMPPPPPKIKCYETQPDGSTTLSDAKFDRCLSVPMAMGVLRTGFLGPNCGEFGTRNGAICCNVTECNKPTSTPSPAPVTNIRLYRCYQPNGKLSDMPMFQSCGVKSMNGRLITIGFGAPNCTSTGATEGQVVSCCTRNGCNVPTTISCYAGSMPILTNMSRPGYQSCAIAIKDGVTGYGGDHLKDCASIRSLASMGVELLKCCNATGCNALPGGDTCARNHECRSQICGSGRCGCSSTVKCANGQWCDFKTSTCKQVCRRDADCTDATNPKCDTKSGRCTIGCSLNTCGTGRACINNLCVGTCTTSSQCSAGQFCHNQACVTGQCMTDSHCATLISTLPIGANSTLRSRTVCDAATRVCVSPRISCFNDRTRSATAVLYRVCLAAQVMVPETNTTMTLRLPGVFGAERIGDCGRAARLFGSQSVRCCSGSDQCNLNLWQQPSNI